MIDDAAKIANILKRSSIAILVDIFIIVNAYLLTMLAFVYEGASRSYYSESLIFIPIAVIVHCIFYFAFGLYRSVDRYIGLRQAVSAVKASAVAVIVLILVSTVLMFIFDHHAGYRALVLIPVGGMMVLTFSCGVRFYPRIFYMRSLREVTSKVNMLIVGAGRAGEQIIRNISNDPLSNMKIVALIDDDPGLKNLEIHGVSIEGSVDDIASVVDRKSVDEILIAIPSSDAEQFQRIWKICSSTGLPVKTLDSLPSKYQSRVGARQIREIQIEDILGRQPVQTDYIQIGQFIHGKTVAVTGAGGSIGSELVTQISQNGPSNIILIDQDETSLYQVHEELKRRHFLNYEIFVADVKSERKMRSIFSKTRPDIVFHAAAYKHVPLMEIHPDVSVLNNVWGTLNVASISGEFGVQSFVNISSDKAVEPVNIMGATKRLSESLVTELDELYPDTRYCSVRFGNVLGSRGSVIPIFRQQILNGGPVTITDPQMTRYFMMISEAVDLVLQAAAFRDHNAIYVLDMGEPMKITDLAQQMIDLLKPEKPVEVVFTGLRPGEKLHEHLFEVNETPEPSSHQKIYRVSAFNWGHTRILDKLPLLFEKARDEDTEMIHGILAEWIPTFRSFDVNKIGQVAPAEEGIATVAAVTPIASCLNYTWSNMAHNNHNEVDDDQYLQQLSAKRSSQ